MFSREDAEESRAGLAALVLPAAAVIVALLAGYFTAVAGAFAGYRAIYYIVVLGVLVIGSGIALTRAEPLRFSFLSLVAVLPFVGVPAPPARIGLMVFDVATLLLTCGLLLRKAFATPGETAPLFPARPLALVWLLLVPCALFARYPARAWLLLLLLFSAYVFFWLAVQELRRPLGLERLAGLLSLTLIIVSAGLFIDSLLHLNLSMRGSNLNQQGWSDGASIWRAGGFFQDPQKAGAFLVSLITFLLVLSVRQRFQGRLRLLVWAAVLIGVPALFLTVSRAAILTFLLVSGAALAAVNRWPAAIKLAVCVVLLLAAVGAALMPAQWSGLVPASLAARLAHSGEELQMRVDIWLDTWEMFARQPLTGIGFGGFQHYLIDTRPMQFSYFGIGADTGVVYVPDQPESGWFKILYETGICGAGAVLLLFVETLRRAVRGIVQAADSATRTELVAALAGLVTFAITFTTLFTTSDPRLLALLAILLAVIWRVARAPAPATLQP